MLIVSIFVPPQAARLTACCSNAFLGLLQKLSTIALPLLLPLLPLLHTGGPHYAPRSVRAAALEVLDALFPMGRRSRRLVRVAFRLLHPAGLLGGFFFCLLLPMRAWRGVSAACLRWVHWGVLLVYRVLRGCMGLVRGLGATPHRAL
jgi:hypothetical protein